MSEARAIPLGEWQRLHPLSPVLRGGLIVIAIAGYVASQVWDWVMTTLGIPGFGGWTDPDTYTPDVVEKSFELGWLVLLGGAVAVIAVVVLAAWLSWRVTEFRVADGQVELRRGIVFRQHRQVPLGRIQAVEITRPVLARLTGLSQVVVQSAGGGDSTLQLAYLGQGPAVHVRQQIVELARHSDERSGVVLGRGGIAAPVAAPSGSAGSAASAGSVAGASGIGLVDDAPPLIRVPNGRLFVATILHPATLVLLLVLAAALLTWACREVGWVAFLGTPAAIPIALGLGYSRVKDLLTHGNFTVTDLDHSLRVRHGMLDLQARTVPLHRVQAIEVRQPLWWRPTRWWRVRVNVAGGSIMDTEKGSSDVALPVGTLEEVRTLLRLLDPRLHADAVTDALLGAGGAHWTGPPQSARWLDPWAWRRNGYAVTQDSVLIRHGRFERVVAIVPHARIQSTTLTQGPVQRRLGLAALELISTMGPVHAKVEHLAVSAAERLLVEQNARATIARRAVPRPPAPPAAMREGAGTGTGAGSAERADGIPPTDSSQVLAPERPDLVD